MRNLRNRKAAFTLIELLVVILILAILAALIVPRLVGRAEDAKRAKAAQDVSSLGSMLNLYRLDVGSYPLTEEGLQALRQQPGEVTGWRGPYSEKPIPLDPWGNPYQYEYGVYGEDTFSLASFGADGQPGGEENAADILYSDDAEEQPATQ